MLTLINLFGAVIEATTAIHMPVKMASNRTCTIDAPAHWLANVRETREEQLLHIVTTQHNTQLFVDLIPQNYIDESGHLLQVFENYSYKTRKLKAGEIRRSKRIGVNTMTSETAYVITATTGQNVIVYQQVFTAAELMNPDFVVVITDQSTEQ